MGPASLQGEGNVSGAILLSYKAPMAPAAVTLQTLTWLPERMKAP